MSVHESLLRTSTSTLFNSAFLLSASFIVTAALSQMCLFQRSPVQHQSTTSHASYIHQVQCVRCTKHYNGVVGLFLAAHLIVREILLVAYFFT
jgi:hypothetical protein